MAYTDTDSFLLKFKNLWHSGVKATLTFQCENGEASVTLKAGLGSLPDHLQGHHGHAHRPPSYYRRQNRRRAAQEAADKDQVLAPQAEQARGEANTDENLTVVADKVTESLVGKEVKEAEQAREEALAAESQKAATEKVGTENNKAETATETFECIICDFKSNWENGLKVHIARKHEKIEQLDGVVDLDHENDERYDNTKHYWKKGWLGTVYQCFLDANKIIDDCDMLEEEKDKEREKILAARKVAFGSSFVNFPPWDK